MIQQIEKVSVVGAGTMGTQIAIQIANYGYGLSLYARNPKNFPNNLQKLRGFRKDPGRMSAQAFAEWEKGAEKVKAHQDLREALQEADLIIEALPEKLELKREIFAQVDSLASENAILATTSSSIPISKIESATKRPQKCVNIHFYQPARANNMADIMGGTKTTSEIMEMVKRFIRSIGCVPLIVKKEILGFCFGGVLRAIYRQALFMWAEGHVDFRDIDRGWMVFSKMDQGPFGIMDAVGLDVIYDTAMIFYHESLDPRDYPPQALKEMIDRKDLGIKTGKGFYTYPGPEYMKPDFLKKTSQGRTHG